MKPGAARPPTACKIIGIAGGTAGGKTTFCRRQLELLPSGCIQVLSLDSYYRCHGDLPPQQRALVNYDHPMAFEHELLVQHLKKLRQGREIEAPCYDFSDHSRSTATVNVKPVQFILVEGILTLHWPELRELFEFKIFVDAPSELRLRRRLERDVEERGRTAESVLQQWQQTVEPMYRQFCEPTRRFADLIIDGSNLPAENLGKILPPQ